MKDLSISQNGALAWLLIEHAIRKQGCFLDHGYQLILDIDPPLVILEHQMIVIVEVAPLRGRP